MKRYKYSDLLLYQDRLIKLYERFGLKFNASNRINKYFVYLSEMDKNRQKDKLSFSEFLKKKKAKYYYSQYYVLEICKIIDAIENSTHDTKLIREKLIYISKGTYLLSEETSNNTKARDTCFELSLFAFLKAKGLNIKLSDPNPDIQFKSDKFIYNIECKRPYSLKSLENHIKKAFKQLDKSKGTNTIPTIALSLEQALLGGDLILDSRDEVSASKFLDATLFTFLQQNNNLLGKIFRNQPCLILYYLSCLAGFRTNIPMANATFVTCNIFNFEPNLSHAINVDLKRLLE